MYGAALLKAIDESGINILTLVEGVVPSELLASRLTQMEVIHQLRTLIDAADGLPAAVREGMPEIDWPGIRAAGQALSGPPGPARNDALLFASQALVPATLMWLRVYQQQHPDWFAMTLG